MRIFYLRDEHKRPVTCVAYDKLDADNTVVDFQISTWNPSFRYQSDRFQRDPLSKRMGREIAIGRLTATRDGCTIYQVPNSGHIKQAIVKYIAKYDEFPKRARLVAERWLLTQAK